MFKQRVSLKESLCALYAESRAVALGYEALRQDLAAKNDPFGRLRLAEDELTRRP